MTGRVFAVVGPSGAGKDALIAGACAACPGLHRSRRTITRSAEAGGEAHKAVTPVEFEARRLRGEFTLHWRAHGLCYGIPTAELAPPGGGDVVFNGSRAALAAARRAIPGLRVILVTAPPAVLAARLAARGREAEAEIAARLSRDVAEPEADAVVINDADVETGVARLLVALYPDRAERWTA
jgi:ribose 1,5-bisphosphokinase